MKYAIVESGGKQFRAVEGGTLEVDRLPVEPGKNIKLEQVLLLADGENVSVGTPLVKDSPVWAKVVEHFKGPKVTIFNYSPKKRIRVKTGHRQNYTRLLVEQIGGAELVAKEPVKVEKAVEAKAEKPVKATKAAKPAAAPKAKPAAKAKAAPAAQAKKPAASKAEVKKKPAAKPASKPAAKAPAKGKAAPAKTETKKPAAKSSPGKKPVAK